MVTENTCEIRVERAWLDDEGRLLVEGPLPSGVAVKLVPRRYKAAPPWWGVDVVGIGSADAQIVEGQTFWLACPAGHFTGTEGIEVHGSGDPIAIPRN